MTEKNAAEPINIELLSNHQKSWVWGRHIILETLRVGRWRIVELLLSDSLPQEERQEALTLAKRNGIPTRLETSKRLEQLCHARDHQGYLGKMGAFPYSSLDEALKERCENTWFALLDAIQDPYNFGAMTRSAEAFGCSALLIGEENQTGVTSLSARCSSGAVNHTPIVKERDIVEMADRLKSEGYAIVGASEKADESLDRFDFCKPVCIAIGNEGTGLREALQTRCDATLRIPQTGRVGSLNAGAAMAVFAYEIARQRREACGENS